MLAAVALIQPLVWELPYADSEALKSQIKIIKYKVKTTWNLFLRKIKYRYIVHIIIADRMQLWDAAWIAFFFPKGAARVKNHCVEMDELPDNIAIHVLLIKKSVLLWCSGFKNLIAAALVTAEVQVQSLAQHSALKACGCSSDLIPGP